MSERPVLLVSNRGPISYSRDAEGTLQPRRGAGGLVSGLSPLLAGTDRQWMAAALSNDDQQAVTEAFPDRSSDRVEISVDGLKAIMLAVDPGDLEQSYDQICNATLWFVHHHLYDLARNPAFGTEWFKAWEAYRRVNNAFAEAVAEVAPSGAAVLIQDYHLCLLGPMLARLRPDVTTVHFSHTPFAAPDQLAVLPDAQRFELLRGMAGHGACGFHTERWRSLFLACCEADGIDPPKTFVAPLGPDAQDLAATVASPACQEERAALRSRVGTRSLIARVDRIELSKNLLRGFQAFDLFLTDYPQWREQVVFVASVYPSRESNEEYVRYHRDMVAVVEDINRRWSTPSWEPVMLDTSDNYPRSIATLCEADVVLVNPVRDGLNLVAKEAMLVSERASLLGLSAQAGAWAELADVATRVHPFDLTQTAEALDQMLSVGPDQRREAHKSLRRAAAVRSPSDWLDDLLLAAEGN